VIEEESRISPLGFVLDCKPMAIMHGYAVKDRGGIKIFKALTRLASNSKFLLAKSEKNSLKSCLF
jgi:hypothetical protein